MKSEKTAGNRKFFVESDAEVNIYEEQGGEIEIYRVEISFGKPCVPTKTTLVTKDAAAGVYSVWDAAKKTRNIGYGKNESFRSRLASWVPFVQTVSADGRNRALTAISDVMTPASTGVKINLEEENVETTITFFDDVTHPTETYSALIRIDRRDIGFDTAVKQLFDWYGTQGYAPAAVPEKAFKPMYSTWYSYLQKITADDVLSECREAVKYGMEAVIIDDGWQTDNPGALYGYTGDWTASPDKFPDMKKTVGQIHRLGMSVILWFSVPFVGYFSRNYDRFRGKYLRDNDDINCSTLDPRYKEVRDFLVGTYVNALKEWDLDGLKLDFIDRFYSNGVISPGMDVYSVEEATRLLLREITAAAKKIRPDVLIEFRQPYMGPAVTSYGNMIRVWDCPLDPLSNRIATLGLRLTCGKSAVHSDMISWSDEDDAESVAARLLSALFSVPQISMRLGEISEDARRVLKNFLDCRIKFADIIDRGELKLSNPESNFSSAEARRNGDAVFAAYSCGIFDAAGLKNASAFNITDRPFLIIKNASGGAYTVYDCKGDAVSRGEIVGGPCELKVPFAGRAEISGIRQ